MKRISFLYLVLLCFFPTALWALPTISLKDLVARSREAHPENIALEHRLRSIEAMRSGEISLPNPMLSYEQMTSTEMSSMKETKWQFTQRIPFPWKTYLTSEMYAAEIEALQAELKQIQLAREAKMTTEYFRWLGLQQKLRLKKEQEVLLAQLIAVQRTRYVAQKVSQVEVVALQIERGNILKEASMLEAELANQVATLEVLAGPGESLKKFEPKAEKLPLPTILSKLSSTEISNRLENQNSELKSLQLMSQKEENSVRQSQAGWVPDLEIMLSEKNDAQGLKLQGWQIGIEIPLWLGAEQRAKISQAKAAYHSAQNRWSEQKRKMQLEAEAMLEEQTQLNKQLELMENGLVQWSGQNVQSAKAAYQTGKMEYANFLALMQSSYQTLADYEDLKVKALENQERITVLFGGNT